MTDFGWDYPPGVTQRHIDGDAGAADPMAEAVADAERATLALDALLDQLSRWKDEAIEAADAPDAASGFLRGPRPKQAAQLLDALGDAVGDVLVSLEGIVHYAAAVGRDEAGEPEDWER